MKISIENFKSIKKLHNFEIKPLTVLSGINSSGKSSFVQLLLLLKQTIELDSTKNPFVLDGDYYEINNFIDIISNKDKDKILKVSFVFSKTEIERFENLKAIPLLNALGNYECLIEINFEVNEDNIKDILVTLFSVKFRYEDGKEQYIIVKSDFDNNHTINTNNRIFAEKMYVEQPQIANIQYSTIYPVKYGYQKEGSVEIGDFKVPDNKYFEDVLHLEDIKVIINSFLQSVSYVGPNRYEPQDEYNHTLNRNNSIGIKGQFVAQVLNEEAPNPINYFEIEKLDNGIRYKNSNKTLVQATKYWMCDYFEVAEDIRAEKFDEIYKVILVNKSGLETTIKHVGFGISQLLPIVVEGLRMPNTGTLIVEQPEIHLHPKIQSQLYDFLYSLTLQGKKVLIETHSSHLITRMRRRIAEDLSNEMGNIIGLTFIENDVFRSIELDDYGTMDYYPDDFIEQEDIELRAIVEAQMKKRIKNEHN